MTGTARFDWDALDAWYEEDEQVFVHPRNRYVRVDALRSHRHVRVSLEGITLADSATPVLVFETGLPTRYYFDRTDVDFGHLVPGCPASEPTSSSDQMTGKTAAAGGANGADGFTRRHPQGGRPCPCCTPAIRFPS